MYQHNKTSNSISRKNKIWLTTFRIPPLTWNSSNDCSSDLSHSATSIKLETKIVRALRFLDFYRVIISLSVMLRFSIMFLSDFFFCKS